ncbi:hypothetical protein VEE27_25770 [Escherichia coli]|nr:hypothetical protein ECAD30_46100 [Escherichia coli AD30]OSL81136.1 hypothetical protein EAWG_05345 [Escherichia coli TA008]BDO55236.1 hypothetical protein TUM1886_22830 [Escherichia coli]BEA45243.1 hypothetical protein VEE27_25770 [Escherichia coli]
MSGNIEVNPRKCHFSSVVDNTAKLDAIRTPTMECGFKLNIPFVDMSDLGNGGNK